MANDWASDQGEASIRRRIENLFAWRTSMPHLFIVAAALIFWWDPLGVLHVHAEPPKPQVVAGKLDVHLLGVAPGAPSGPHQ